jgi:hypothetical protein
MMTYEEKVQDAQSICRNLIGGYCGRDLPDGTEFSDFSISFGQHGMNVRYTIKGSVCVSREELQATAEKKYFRDRL